ncbi:hypothetical protein BJX99DRAFT_73936 [Aspergillus californicus]
MQRAMEQAGPVFTGWISSCWSCLDFSGGDEGARHPQALKQKGAEREMEICHSQPHLVPPMKLVVYDDLPSPGPPRASSFPTWMMDGRNIASRASSRASMSFKRKSTAPVRISAPTDFRRVTTLPNISTVPRASTVSTVPTEYRPLELNFQRPANRLPDLPRFSEFKMEEDHLQAPLTRPPRALSFTTDFSYQTRPRTHQPSSSFHLPRKPVGSGSRRSSLATLELLMEKQISDSHPLIPHFSSRASTASIATGLATSPFTSPPTWPDSTVGSPSFPKNSDSRKSYDAPRTPKPTTPQDKSLPPIPAKFYEPPSTLIHSPPLESSSNPTPPSSRSSRVTQWLLQTANASATPTKTPTSPSTSPRISSLSAKFSLRIRSHTLSGSTLASATTNIQIPTLKATTAAPTPPLSQTTTAPTMTMTTARTSTLDSRLGIEKDFDMPYAFPPRQTQSSILSDEHARAHPTIFEAQQHDLGFSHYDVEHNRHSASAIGVAY